ncbi:trbL/VirB6 plasmid conjugal transfer family protein [Orientia chuto str. Dubai]|uniref:TrbL/VirB6 plasmid conjugal transfer family protein n=1 Tax=Orientia chuto str. Dubai TaxID=1359168 RepID=A0A0F3MNZ2_9RICK|nr:type IV secretion system protein [Candidatus Orientia mediorientalis]KJV57157.1 trbL/VirB6 plasmid conjugal transfer family protein [Orientia chuto str. Dubai]
MNQQNISFLKIFIKIILFCSIISYSMAECIDADDFGFPIVTVSSRYNAKQLIGQKDHQVAPWVDSKLLVNGKPIVIMVKHWNYHDYDNDISNLSAWSAWYGTTKNKHTLASITKRFPECKFHNNKTFPDSADDNDDVPVINPPCLFKHGIGLYALIAKPGVNPNANVNSQSYGIHNKTINFHVGQNYLSSLNATEDAGFFDTTPDGNIVKTGGYFYKYQPQESEQYTSGKLYFKILDRFYDDNNGQYKIIIKSGVGDEKDDPSQFLINLVKEMLFGNQKNQNKNGIIQNLFTNILNNPSYKLVVNLTLILFIAFSGLAFLIGNINMTAHELVIRTVKILVISILLNSAAAWNFFYNYLFFIFVDGPQFIIKTINEATAIGPGSSSILGLMIAPHTLKKLFSILFVHWGGFIYIICYLILLYYILIISFRATILYLNALILVGIGIIVGPVFLCFVLFQFTKPIFENWIKQLTIYALQPVILFAGIAFVGMFIRHEIYASLGFRVCEVPFPPIANTLIKIISGDSSKKQSLLNLWFPAQVLKKTLLFNQKCANIPVPEDHIVYRNQSQWQCSDGISGNSKQLINSPDISNEEHCSAYECKANRYVELPFLDPNINKDRHRIRNFFAGNFVQWDSLLLLAACVFLLSMFNDKAIALANYISSGGDRSSASEKATTAIVSTVTPQSPTKFIPQLFNKTSQQHTSKDSNNPSSNFSSRPGINTGPKK